MFKIALHVYIMSQNIRDPLHSYHSQNPYSDVHLSPPLLSQPQTIQRGCIHHRMTSDEGHRKGTQSVILMLAARHS